MKLITTEVLKQKTLTESEIKLLCKRANAEATREATREALSDFEGSEITPEQESKGLAWLINQYKTPRGVERKNNPFGYREIEAIEKFSHFTFDGLYDAGNAYISFFVPIYTVHGSIDSGTSFQYVLSGGKINIIG